MSDNTEHRSDWDLLEFCKQADDDAWKELVRRHQRRLYLSIQQKLGEKAKDISLVQDIAQEVFVLLIDKEYERLALYDPQRGCFDTFLRMVARQVIRQRQDDERTQIALQGSLEDQEPVESSGDAGLVQAELAEYLEALTPQQRRCLREKLLKIQGPKSEPSITPENERFLRYKLRKKWKDHFDKS